MLHLPYHMQDVTFACITCRMLHLPVSHAGCYICLYHVQDVTFACITCRILHLPAPFMKRNQTKSAVLALCMFCVFLLDYMFGRTDKEGIW